MRVITENQPRGWSIELRMDNEVIGVRPSKMTRYTLIRAPDAGKKRRLPCG